MVVRVAIGSLGHESPKAPAVGLTDERRELGVLKVSGDDLDFKFTRLVDLP